MSSGRDSHSGRHGDRKSEERCHGSMVASGVGYGEGPEGVAR